MFAHLAALVTLDIPFVNIIGPLVIWLVQKDRYPFVDDQGKEAVNFQISLSIYMALAGALALTIILLPLAVLAIAALAIFGLVMAIIAAVRANRGERFRYPLTIRFIA